MVAKSFLISFELQLDRSTIAVSLQAEVEIHENPACHVVWNIRSARHGNTPVIPAVTLMKKDSLWVHSDSEKSTDLSVCIGKAIDALDGKLE